MSSLHFKSRDSSLPNILSRKLFTSYYVNAIFLVLWMLSWCHNLLSIHQNTRSSHVPITFHPDGPDVPDLPWDTNGGCPDNVFFHPTLISLKKIFRNIIRDSRSEIIFSPTILGYRTIKVRIEHFPWLIIISRHCEPSLVPIQLLIKFSLNIILEG